jgi:hypothetical protein
MSSGDGMDSTLECVVPGVRGFLLLHPIMASAYDRRLPRLETGDAYP